MSPLTPTSRLPILLTSSDIRHLRTLRMAFSTKTMSEKVEIMAKKTGFNYSDSYLPSSFSAINLRRHCWMDRIEFRMRLGWNDDDSMCVRAGAVEELGSRALIIADKARQDIEKGFVH
ncbi:hypothetical protein PS2_005237 [Malus domestica]